MPARLATLVGVGLALLLASCTAATSTAAAGAYGGSGSDPVFPPTPLTERVPPRPNSNAYWEPGHWSWNDARWIWRKGYYVERPKTAAAWIPGH